MKYLLLFLSLNLYAQKKHSVEVLEIPEAIQKQMMGLSMKKGCPVPFKDLRLLKFLHYDFENSVTQGELVVHKKVAEGLKTILFNLFRAEYPIQIAKLVDHYKADDMTSMKANNTSAFNCRPITGKKNEFSLHSYGLAIDINPLINPYIKGDKVLPPEGAKYQDRSQAAKGLIKANDLIVQEFKKQGWSWGGDWKQYKDYQHFEQPKSILQ